MEHRGLFSNNSRTNDDDMFVVYANSFAQKVIVIILLLKVYPLQLALNCRPQFWLDRLGTWLTLLVSTESISSHEYASHFGLEFFYMRKTPKNYRENRVSRGLFT